MRMSGSNKSAEQLDAAAESVWDYPRPPRLECCRHRIRFVFGGQTIAESEDAFRVLETSHPPAYYIPPSDMRSEFLLPSSRRTWCEWKGEAHYWNLWLGHVESANAAWSYPRPTQPFATIRDYLAFYPAGVDACYVGDERVTAQEGDFYGGSITSNIRGPFKGGPATFGW